MYEELKTADKRQFFFCWQLGEMEEQRKNKKAVNLQPSTTHLVLFEFPRATHNRTSNVIGLLKQSVTTLWNWVILLGFGKPVTFSTMASKSQWFVINSTFLRNPV